MTLLEEIPMTINRIPMTINKGCENVIFETNLHNLLDFLSSLRDRVSEFKL